MVECRPAWLSLPHKYQPLAALVLTVATINVLALVATAPVVNVPRASVWPLGPTSDMLNVGLTVAVTVIWSAPAATIVVAQVPLSMVAGVESWVVTVPVRFVPLLVGVVSVLAEAKLKQ